MTYEESGDFLRHTACKDCGSSDALALYSSGTAYCYSHRQFYDRWPDWVDASGERTTGGDASSSPIGLDELPECISDAEYKEIQSRRISARTCRKYRYRQAVYHPPAIDTHGKELRKGTPEKCHVWPICDNKGNIVGHKIRLPGKNFVVKKKGKPTLGFTGMPFVQGGGKRVFITEGELDMLAVSEVLDGTWPVVSLPNGAASAEKTFRACAEWLNKFDEVVIVFDNDDAGREAEEAVKRVVQPFSLRIARLPLKDPCDMLKAGRVKELLSALWNAEQYVPEGITELAEVLDTLDDYKPERGFPWFNAAFDELTYGRLPGELWVLGAGTGAGKSDFLHQQMAFDLLELKIPVVALMLEQSKEQTAIQILNKVGLRRFDLPDGGWTQEDLDEARKKLKEAPQSYVWDTHGLASWKSLKGLIRYLAQAKGYRIFYLDNFTQLTAAADDERKFLEEMMAEAASLTEELKIVLVGVSHLATPEGTPHEEGGHVAIRHFKGSRAIGFWAHGIIGLERNQQAEDDVERRTTCWRLLKSRRLGHNVGRVVKTVYNPITSAHDVYSPELHGVKEANENDEPTEDFA